MPNLFKRITSTILKPIKCMLFVVKHELPNLVSRSSFIPKEILKVKSMSLIFGHSNYIKNQGGTEKIILEQIEDILKNNDNALFVYPKGHATKNLFLKPRQYGLILNGYEIFTLTHYQLSNFFQSIAKNVDCVIVHHWLFWPLSDLTKTLNRFKKNQSFIRIYVHDFYFKCPKVNYFCRDGEKRCRSSFYKCIISKWRDNQNTFLKIANELVTPSSFMQSELAPIKSTVIPPISILKNAKKFNLAYLGAPSPIKGMDMWKELTANPHITRLFDLFHIGSDQPDDTEKKVKLIPYSYKHSKDSQAIQILLDEKIDYVLLWSQVPESFSFTAHEAIEAGCFIITNSRSGNIAQLILNGSAKGIILNSDFELVEYLLRIPNHTQPAKK